MGKKNIIVERFPSFMTLLTLLFIALKLTGYINWSWWWILAPMWFPLVLLILLLVFIILRLRR